VVALARGVGVGGGGGGGVGCFTITGTAANASAEMHRANGQMRRVKGGRLGSETGASFNGVGAIVRRVLF